MVSPVANKGLPNARPQYTKMGPVMPLSMFSCTFLNDQSASRAYHASTVPAKKLTATLGPTSTPVPMNAGVNSKYQPQLSMLEASELAGTIAWYHVKGCQSCWDMSAMLQI